jgi:catechol 2,3-dioxygenase-like lactoylglutathione lyase family enzyme
LDFQHNGLYHVGLTVSDLDRSLDWYRRILGLEAEFVADGSGPELSRAVGVHDATIRFAMIPLGNAYLELLEYTSPKGKAFDRTNADIGASHVCFEVPDMHSAYSALKKKGAAFLSDPFPIIGGPLDGCSFAYFRDPDGLCLEILQRASASQTVIGQSRVGLPRH